MLSGYSPFFCYSVVAIKRIMQSIVQLSASEDEVFSATKCKNICFICTGFFKKKGLKVKLPIFLEVDVQASADLEKTEVLVEGLSMLIFVSIF